MSYCTFTHFPLYQIVAIVWNWNLPGYMDHRRNVFDQALDMQTNAMEQASFLTSLKSLSWQTIQVFLWKTKDYYSVHKSQLLVGNPAEMKDSSKWDQHFNIILTHAPSCPKPSVSYTFPNTLFLRVSQLPANSVSHLSQSIRFDHYKCNNVWLWI